MMRGRTAVLLLGICASCRQPPEVAFVSDRFAIAPEFAGELCGGNIAFMETRLAAIEALLGIEAPGRIRYNWVEDVDGFCHEEAEACAEGATIFGPWKYFEHELVHAAVTGSLGRPKSFLGEGVAVALSGGSIAPTSVMPSEFLGRTPRDSSAVDNRDFYGTAGHFVRFLLDEFGPEKLVQLYRASDYDDSVAQFRGQFEQAYGLSFDEVEALYLDAAYDVYPPPFGCPEPTMAWDGVAFVAEVAVDCSEAATLRVSATQMERSATVRPDSSVLGAFTLDGVEERFPDRCFAEPYDFDGMAEFVGLFQPGSYTVTVTAELDAPRTVRAELRPL
jgi:hypothetical protein